MTDVAATGAAHARRPADLAARARSGCRCAPIRGAMAGLIVIIVLILLRGLRRCHRARTTRSSSSASIFRQPAGLAGGRHSGTFRSAPTISAATCSRASSTARGISLFIGIIVVTLSLALGHRSSACCPASSAGLPDIGIMRLMDIMLAMPSLLLSIVIVVDPGPRPDQCHDRRRHHLCAALCAPDPRGGADRAVQGLCHGLAGRRRRHAAPHAERRCCRTAWRR